MTFPQPWLDDSLSQLDLRRRDRCLLLGCPTGAHLAAVSRLVGPTATIVIVEPDTELAQLASRAQHERLQVLAYTPDGHERFGTFDALLACPLTTMGWPLQLWAELIPANLRPGGRFVLDLPAATACDPLRRAWESVGGTSEDLHLLAGPSEHTIAAGLRDHGLRNVETSVGTHLLHLDSPFELAGLLREVLSKRDPALASARLEDFERKLVELLQTTSEVEVVFHRTRVHGRR